MLQRDPESSTEDLKLLEMLYFLKNRSEFPPKKPPQTFLDYIKCFKSLFVLNHLRKLRPSEIWSPALEWTPGSTELWKRGCLCFIQDARGLTGKPKTKKEATKSPLKIEGMLLCDKAYKWLFLRRHWRRAESSRQCLPSTVRFPCHIIALFFLHLTPLWIFTCVKWNTHSFH